MVFYELIEFYGGSSITECSCECFLTKEKAMEEFREKVWDLTHDHTDIPISEEDLLGLEERYEVSGNAVILSSAYDPHLDIGIVLLLVEDHKEFMEWEHKDIILKLLDWKGGKNIIQDDLITLIQKLLEFNFSQKELTSLGFGEENIEEAWTRMGKKLY